MVMMFTCRLDGGDVLQAELARKVALLGLAIHTVCDCSGQAQCLR